MTADLIRLIVMFVVLALYIYPIIVLSIKKRIAYKTPNNKKNLMFVLLAFAFMIVTIILITLLQNVVTTILNIPFIGNLITNSIANIPAAYDYVIFCVLAILLNAAILNAFLLIKSGFVKHIKKTAIKTAEQILREKEEKEKKVEEEKSKKKRLISKFKKPCLQMTAN